MKHNLSLAQPYSKIKDLYPIASPFIINPRYLSTGVEVLGQFVEATSLIPELTHFYEFFPHLLRITVWRTNGHNAGMLSTAERATTEFGLGVEPH